jgi:CheY-like chemotaxis protein
LLNANPAPMKILLVDDDSDDRALLREAIKMIDHHIRCDVAEDGSEALIKLNHGLEQPDLIFMDVNMPVLDGRECLRQIKASEHLKHIPVIICSNTEDQEEITEFLAQGASYISKPNSFGQLLEAVGKHIMSLKHSRQHVCQL